MRAASRAWIARAITLTGTVTAQVAPAQLRAATPTRSQSRPPTRIALAEDPAWTFEPKVANAAFGYVVTVADDVNGDGNSDVLVSAPQQSVPQGIAGRVYGFHGSSSGLGAAPSWTAEALAAEAQFGAAAAPAGDVNGDGYADVIIGAWKWSNGEHEEGMARVYLGSPTGLGAAPAWTVESNQLQAYLGTSVCTAGDVNGDGYADVIVSDPRYGEEEPGAVYVWYGSADDLGEHCGPCAPGDAGWFKAGNVPHQRFGLSAESAGDVNGDGFSDIVIGQDHSVLLANGAPGTVWVFMGGPAGLEAEASRTATGEQDVFSLLPPAGGAGDVNGDGYSDIFVRAFDEPDGAPERRMLLWYGSAQGLGDPGTHANADATLESSEVFTAWGHTSAGAGDINGDGIADLVVTDALAELNGPVQVYLGSPSGIEVTPSWVSGDDGLTRTAAVLGGDLNGDGLADLVSINYNDIDLDLEIRVWYGGSSQPMLLPRQRRVIEEVNGIAPIAPLGLADDNRDVRLSAFARSTFGRTRARIEWEMDPLATLFDGSGAGAGSYFDTDLAGAEGDGIASRLTAEPI